MVSFIKEIAAAIAVITIVVSFTNLDFDEHCHHPSYFTSLTSSIASVITSWLFDLSYCFKVSSFVTSSLAYLTSFVIVIRVINTKYLLHQAIIAIAWEVFDFKIN